MNSFYCVLAGLSIGVIAGLFVDDPIDSMVATIFACVIWVSTVKIIVDEASKK